MPQATSAQGESCDEAALASFVFLSAYARDRHTPLGILIGELCHNCLGKTIKLLEGIIVQRVNSTMRLIELSLVDSQTS
jgi:hypothetical protein